MLPREPGRPQRGRRVQSPCSRRSGWRLFQPRWPGCHSRMSSPRMWSRSTQRGSRDALSARKHTCNVDIKYLMSCCHVHTGSFRIAVWKWWPCICDVKMLTMTRRLRRASRWQYLQRFSRWTATSSWRRAWWGSRRCRSRRSSGPSSSCPRGPPGAQCRCQTEPRRRSRPKLANQRPSARQSANQRPCNYRMHETNHLKSILGCVKTGNLSQR